MRKSFTFNGIRKPWLHMTRGRNKPPFAPIKRNLVKVSGMPGAHLGGTEIEPVSFGQPIAFKYKDDAHDMQLKDELASWLITDYPASLEFDDEPGRTYYGYVQNTLDDLGKMARLREGTIQFLCLDPFGYGEEDEEYLPSDRAVLIDNIGTADASPTFELDVLKKITYALVAKDDSEYMMIGRPFDVDNQEYEKYETVMFDDASSTTGWTAANAGEINGTIAGSMSSNGYRFQTVDYGVGSSWHGPAIKQGLSDPVSDFRVETKMTFRNTEAADIGRAEVYGLDVNGNQLFKLAMKDILGGKRQSFGEARVGGGVTNHFLISESGDKGWEWNEFEGVLRIEREGREWKAYIAQITDGSHTASRTSDVWTDHQGRFTAELAQVVVHTAKNGTYQAPNQGIDSVRVEKINHRHTGVPYIAGPGDRISFDHKTEEIFINGELRKDLKNLGAHHFLLPPGYNTLSLLPSGGVQGVVKWKPTYY
ncbi:distal tail protein Dit [Halobacillus litoralis]|uniref:distal tail protein Dit n=1 Tax=Halobacillus litoralis TaxID=45668 RepID=UPI001CD1D3C5|nr:distal tail protein Dit [Halobacillus litoralis]MCA1021790.1 phage tail family protein [Halobacillus litoralis]